MERRELFWKRSWRRSERRWINSTCCIKVFCPKAPLPGCSDFTCAGSCHTSTRGTGREAGLLTPRLALSRMPFFHTQYQLFYTTTHTIDHVPRTVAILMSKMTTNMAPTNMTVASLANDTLSDDSPHEPSKNGQQATTILPARSAQPRNNFPLPRELRDQ